MIECVCPSRLPVFTDASSWYFIIEFVKLEVAHLDDRVCVPIKSASSHRCKFVMFLQLSAWCCNGSVRDIRGHTFRWQHYTTDFIENALPQKPTNSKNSNSSVQIQIKPKSQFEFVRWDTEKSSFSNAVDFGYVAFSVKTVICPSDHDCSLQWESSIFHCGVATVSRID